ncbi:uncharacterized protein C3orf22-like isoform X1 [Dipodomys merriami]|uniref:uncharacterized protein C3orf22-like isoform X1 n=1 Tax=Dipodomys merriami TaxID=94247 RepID=UPI00384D8C15
MASNATKKSRKSKKSRVKTQERFAKKFPYRFSWLAEHSSESPPSWEKKNVSLKDQLPLQKKLVPTRSIPISRVGAPSLTPSNNSPSPRSFNASELKSQILCAPKPSDTFHRPVLTSETPGPSGVVS